MKLLLTKGILSTHPPICDCEGCRMSSPVVSQVPFFILIPTTTKPYSVLLQYNDVFDWFLWSNRKTGRYQKPWEYYLSKHHTAPSRMKKLRSVFFTVFLSKLIRFFMKSRTSRTVGSVFKTISTIILSNIIWNLVVLVEGRYLLLNCQFILNGKVKII